MDARELLREVRRIEIITRRLVQDTMAGSYHSVFKGRGMSFDEVRPYQPGDEIRLIDWNVTARTGEVHVKQFVEERELTVVVAVDVSASMRTGSGTGTKTDLAARLADTVALSAIHNGDQVGLLLFSQGKHLFVPPKKTRGHGLRVIREVLAAEPLDGARTDLAGALDYLGLILRRRSVVFLVSDLVDVSGCERQVRAITQRHDLIPLHIRDPFELDPPAIGTPLMRDPEEGAYLLPPLFSGRYRRRLKEAVAEQIADVERLFHRAGTDVVPVELGQSPVGPLLRYFRLRAKRL